MNRYDTTRGTYKPAIQVARYSAEHFEGTQWGDVVAVHGGRVGISWESAYGRYRYFEVITEAALSALVEMALDVQAEWAAQQAAEIAAETNIPQHLVW